jgi:hypothetical protein
MYAGLPLQLAFTEALLEPRGSVSHPMHPLITHLGKFVHDAFDHNVSAKAKHWPNLEDLFTNIDLAANTGHHLGASHAPSQLRMTRRVLLARMMYMLNERYVDAEASKTEEWNKLDGFFKALDIKRSAFISINWDTVIERRLAERRGLDNFDYRCGAIAARFRNKGNVIGERPVARGRQDGAGSEDSRFRELALLRQLPTALLVLAGRCDSGSNAAHYARRSRQIKNDYDGRLREMAMPQLHYCASDN